MDKQQAKAIIKETFETAFDKSRFTNFIVNLLNIRAEQIEDKHPYSGNLIPDSYEKSISTLERIAKYTDGEHKIDILIVKLKKESSIERARTMQRNFIAWYLNGSRGNEMKDAALVAFVSPGESDWRFSLVKMDYKFEKTQTGKIKVKEEFTPARRWSFLVGSNEKSHTAQSRLVNILANDEQAPTLKEIENAFDIETVTKEFFLKYRELFLRTKEELDHVVKKDPKVKADFEAKGVDTVNFAKKLLGQIVFLYFLQKKGWFGAGRDAAWGYGSKHFLRELFKKTHSDYHNFFNDILEPLFYEALRIDRSHDDDYYSRFNCKIPFLNGGLFDPIGNYDWVHTDICLSDKLFSNTNKTKEGDTGTGILDVFDRYNFTVKEDEPLEKEVAIDPELLGKTYEKFNAIRPDNYDEFKAALKSGKTGEENKFNKKFGVYYTPREIVHYMCRQSLINYLHTELNSGASSYQKVGDVQTDAFGNKVKTGQLDLTIEHPSTPLIAIEDIETLIHFGEQVSENEVRVLNEGRETKTYSYKLPESIRDNAGLIDCKLEEITVCDPAVGSGAFPVGMMSEIVRARNVVSSFIQGNTRTPYEFKRHCIEHSLYGVDIDPGAVEIAKLRLWLSLVVDENDIKNIKPLPNLDYKIVCGNSLLGYPYSPRGLEKVEKLKNQFINETRPSEKNKLREQIDYVIYDLFKNTENNLSYQVNFDFRINFSEVFHEKDGFDVMIGNPPYINIKEMKEDANVFRKHFSTAYGCYDIYVLFFEKSIHALHINGILTFITSNKFLISDYAKNLRAFFLNNTVILKLLDLADCKKVFEALVSPAITILRKQKIRDYDLNLAILKDDDIHKLDNINFIKVNVQQLSENIKGPFNIYIDSSNRTIMEKINNSSIKLFNIANVRTGVMGFEYWNMESFIRDGKMNNESIRIITNSHLERYRFLFDKKINLYKKIFRNPYIDMKKAPLNKPTKDFFLGEKIIVRGVAKRLTAQLDLSGYAALVAVHGIFNNNKDVDKNYILALLNSSLYNWLHLTTFYTARIPKGSLKYPISFLKNLPLRKIPKTEQKPFLELADGILAITKDADYMQNPQKQSKVKVLEQEIDHQVYKLYDLTDEEIDIIEGNKK